MLNRFGALSRPILDLLFPPFCPVCDHATVEAGNVVCQTCWNGIPLLDPLQAQEVRNGDQIDTLRSLADLSPGLQTILHLGKYRGFDRIFKILGRRLGGIVLANEVYAAAHAIIPVPLHRLRYRERGFNQSALLAEGISSLTRIPSKERVLRRRRYTRSQATEKLRRGERRLNVRGAFEVTDPKTLVGKSVILVDDIVTTGATLNACASVLKEAGAGVVLALTCAKA